MSTFKVRDNRKPGHFWASNQLIRRDGATLGVYGVAVYCTLATYADNNEQDAYPSVATIAKQLGCSTRKVRYSLKQLEERGWIKIEPNINPDNPKQNYSNTYYLLETPPPAHDAVGGTAQDAPGTAQDADELYSENIHSIKESGAAAPPAPPDEPLTDHALTKNTIIEALGVQQEDITCWGAYDKASKKLRSAHATPDEIRGTARYCRKHFDTFGPMALATHLEQYRAEQRMTYANGMTRAEAEAAAADVLAKQYAADNEVLAYAAQLLEAA